LRRPRAIVINNDDPESDYGACHLAAAMAPRFETAVVSPVGGFADGRAWVERHGADALILSGSDRSVGEDLPWMREEEELLRFAVVRGLPVLAICFGHQLLARAFGAAIVSARKRVGLFEIEPTIDDPVFEGADRRLVVPEQHADQVAEVPPGFVLLATSEYCRVQAMRHRERLVYGFQFHPCYEADVFDVDEEWGALAFSGAFVHDGSLILANVARLFVEGLR